MDYLRSDAFLVHAVVFSLVAVGVAVGFAVIHVGRVYVVMFLHRRRSPRISVGTPTRAVQNKDEQR